MNEQVPIWSPRSIKRLGPSSSLPLPAIVAVPARNEVERLPKTLTALDAQENIDLAATGVVLLLNNCTDGTLEAVRAMDAALHMPVWAVEIDLAPPFAIEWEYQNLAVEAESLADPRPHDAWPRHNQNCGANAAITLECYRAIGGLPPEPVGEDRAMFNEVRLRDGKIRHSLRAHVVTSARTEGRAFGGMADALRLRDDPGYPCDDLLETALQTLHRNRMRAKMRKSWMAGRGASPDPRSTGGVEAQAPRYFGQFWSLAEGETASLAHTPLTSVNMRGELAKMRRLVARLRKIRSS